MSQLGSGQNTASIYSRDGRDVLLPLPAGAIEWNRGLCQITTATVTLPPDLCTPDLDDVHTWAHSLVIHRDRDRVWEGPIRKRRDTRTGLTLTASDVLGWTSRRPVVRRQVTDSPVRDELEWVLNRAFDTDDPNIIAHLQLLGDASQRCDHTLAKAEKYAADALSALATDGGRWTALGRSVVLWDEADNIGQLTDLSPENHLTADVEVTEDGDNLATQAVGRNDDGVLAEVTPSGGGPVDAFYGHVGTIVPSGGHTPTGVARSARQYLNRSYPAPITIEVPSDAALRPDAPYPITSLVPGLLVPVVTTTATARTIRQTFMLTGVKVTQQAGQSEVVAITLAPPSEALSA